MVTSTELSNLAGELRSLAGKVDNYAGTMKTAVSSVDTTVSGIPDFWGGPLADEVEAKAGGLVDGLSGADGHLESIGTAIRTLANRADTISGDMETLENDRKNPPARLEGDAVDDYRSGLDGQIGDKEQEWRTAVSNFDGNVEGAVAALQELTRYDLDLPIHPAADPGFVSLVLDDFDADGLAELAELLVEEGDAEGVQILANLLGTMLGGMSDDEIGAFLSAIATDLDVDLSPQLLYMLLWASETLPPAAFPWLAEHDGAVPPILSDEQLEILEELLGEGSPGLWTVKMYERLLAEYPEGPDVILGLLDDYRINGGYNANLAEALANFFADDPDALDLWLNRSVDGRASDLQKLIDFIDDGTYGDGLQQLLDSYGKHVPVGNTNFDGLEWSDWMRQMAELQARIDDAGGNASFDAGGTAWFIVNKGAGLLPGGEAVQTGLSGVQTVVSGYQGDTTYKNLGDKDQRRMDFYVLAMSAVATSDPEIAADLGPLLDGGDDAAQAILDFQDGRSDIHEQISQIAGDLEGRYQDALADAG